MIPSLLAHKRSWKHGSSLAYQHQQFPACGPGLVLRATAEKRSEDLGQGAKKKTMINRLENEASEASFKELDFFMEKKRGGASG